MANWGDFAGGRGDWTSQTYDANGASNLSSGLLTWVQSTPAGTSAAWFSRSSADNITWGAWASVNGDGTLASAANRYVQIKSQMVGVAGSSPTVPTVTSATLTFDGTPSMTALNGVTWTAGGYFTFSVLEDLCTICNGIDAPAKYDGTTLALLGGSPPTGASYQAIHQNRLWAAKSQSNPSRLYYSDPLNQSSWPALNFIDVSPDDGDQITGILEFSNVIVIWKQHSTWVVTGDSIDNFALVRIHAGVGCIAPQSITIVEMAAKQFLAWVSDVGVYFSDLNSPTLATRRLQPTWDGLNGHKLDIAAAGYFQDEFWVSVPSGQQIANDTVLMLDTLRDCWDERTNWPFSGYVVFREGGKEKYLAADANVGQIYEFSGFNDLGSLTPFQYETKSLDYGAGERVKRIRRVIIRARASNAAGALSVAFRPDLGSLSSALPAQSVPNDGEVHTIIVYPAQVGVITAHTLGINVQETANGARTEIHSIAVEYSVKQARPS